MRSMSMPSKRGSYQASAQVTAARKLGIASIAARPQVSRGATVACATRSRTRTEAKAALAALRSRADRLARRLLIGAHFARNARLPPCGPPGDFRHGREARLARSLGALCRPEIRA